VPTLTTTNAITLGRRPWSESSQIVTLVTPGLGRLGAVARGSRKMTSDIGPAFEPITESEVVLSQSANNDLAQVRSADVIEYFSALKKSFVRVTLATALCELTSRALPEAEANEVAYEHLRMALSGIDGASDRDAVNWLWWFCLALASDVGYAPQFDSCVNCGTEERPHRWFSAADGGPLCDKCQGQHLRGWLPETQEALRRLLNAGRDQIETERIGKAVNREVRSLIEGYYRYHVPGFSALKSLDMLATDDDAESGKTSG
jgi:DNA repair protein RecO (recombination protein O)